MASAEIDTVSAELEAAGYTFRASGSTVKFNGFMAVYDYSEDGDEGDGKKSKLPGAYRGRKAEMLRDHAGTALHGAAGKVQRGFACQIP